MVNMRTLKRPMFNNGGSTNEGIMTGLVDRRKYANGIGPVNSNLDTFYQSPDSEILEKFHEEMSSLFFLPQLLFF